MSPIPRIHMPKLQQLEGPASIAFLVVPGSLTSQITIYWDTNSTTSFSDTLSAVARSDVNIVWLINVVPTWDCELLSAIANHLPRLQQLIVYTAILPAVGI
ncbi:hypothetical protein B0H17DRAFT_1191808 [Mycena rosella]|uniref:Uncharacterized protein n=1 Tax=Mycena rosella TaxID=1033263 RepID=A0AAD7GYV5_MYCRO|nr:hypothetical protein B0H17DRAFT_1191808 [Mycena rosella]